MKTNYPTKKLGEILELCDSGTWGDESSDGMPLLRSTNMQNGELVLDDVKYIDVPKDKIERYTLREGDILITKSSGSVDHIGKSLFITKEMDGKYGFSNFTQRLRVNRKIVLPKWVYLKISNPATRDFLLGASQTTTGLRNLKIPALKELEIPLPPLAEQKKIVAKLERVLGKISEAKKLRIVARENADNLLPAELHHVFNSKFKNQNEKLQSKIQNLEEKELGSVAKLVRGPFGGSLKKEIFVNDGDCVYEQGNVIDSDLKNFRYHITPEKFEEMKRFAVSAGDILMSCSGTIGRFVIIPQNFKKGIINQALLKITPNQKIIAAFLKYALEEYLLLNNTHVKGMAIKNIAAVKELKKIKIPLPPLAEQKKIVKHLDSLSEKIRELQQFQKSTQSDLLTLEQATLHKSFL